MNEREAFKQLGLYAMFEGDSMPSQVKEAIIVGQKSLEKQIAKKPLQRIRLPFDYDGGICPLCNSGVNEKMKFCDQCGQKLEWGEEDED